MNNVERPRVCPPRLTDKIVRNFYLSFKFSQGHGPLQAELMRGVAQLYNTKELKKEFPHIRALETIIGPRIKKMRLPTGHTSTDQSGFRLKPLAISNMFNDEWNIQRTILYSRSGTGPELDEVFDSLPRRILFGLIQRDMIYVQNGRPGRMQNSIDMKESFVRSYILESRPTTSEEYDNLFLRIRKVVRGLQEGSNLHMHNCSDSELLHRLQMLSSLWSSAHAGRSFFPEGE